MNDHDIELYDVVIAGAGPAGCSCALALENSGLKVALIDKALFPRDKICGDFIAAQGLRALYSIRPSLKDRFEKFPQKVTNRSTAFYVGHAEPLEFHWVLRSYTITRERFDNELVDEVSLGGKTTLFLGEKIGDVVRNGEYLTVVTEKRKIRTRIVVGADGAHSVVSRKLAGYKVDRDHYGGSVRCYFKNVKNIDPAQNEVYASRDIVPGYFWLFPTAGDEANVGLGMHSTYIKKNNIDLKRLFYDFIESSPVLRSKLDGAEMMGKLDGFGLPFFSKIHTISGDNFMLCGDAASMIDPINGEGIMPAIQSGKMVAEQIEACFDRQRFDASFMSAYADKVARKIWPDMRLHAWVVKHFATRYRLLNTIGYTAAKFPPLRRALQKLA